MTHHRISLLFLSTSIFFLANIFESYALPQYAILSGNRCMNCHANIQGANLRNDLGWYSMHDQSVLKPKNVGLGWLYDLDRESNTFFDGALTIGLDARVQTARSPTVGAGEELPDRKYFPMQTALSASYTPLNWLTVEGVYNVVATGKKDPVTGTRSPYYPGQQTWQASVLLQPTLDYPQLRAGFFQPSIGIRYDDHTGLIRQFAARSGSVYSSLAVPPNAAEFGAELMYTSQKWLTIGGGVFGSNYWLGQVRPLPTEAGRRLADPGDVMYLARVQLHDHNTFFDNVNSYIGLSQYSTLSSSGSGATSMTNVFAGVGISDLLCLMTEYMHTKRTESSGAVLVESNNIMAQLTWQAMTSLLVELRADQANTWYAGSSLMQQNQQVTLGTQIFILPYLVLRPDYRWIWTDEVPIRTSQQNHFRRFNMQLQIWY